MSKRTEKYLLVSKDRNYLTAAFSLRIPNPSAEPQPELAEPQAEPVPPTICVLFAIYELVG